MQKRWVRNAQGMSRPRGTLSLTSLGAVPFDPQTDSMKWLGRDYCTHSVRGSGAVLEDLGKVTRSGLSRKQGLASLPGSQAFSANPSGFPLCSSDGETHSEQALPNLGAWVSTKSCPQGAPSLKPSKLLSLRLPPLCLPGFFPPWEAVEEPLCRRGSGRAARLTCCPMGLLLTPGPGWRTSTPTVVPPTGRSPAAPPTITRRVWAPTRA